MRSSETAPYGAVCATHPLVPASATCPRCGNFMCAECSTRGGESQCPACRALSAESPFPFTRADFSFDRLWGFVLERWQREWVMLSVAVLVMFGATLAVGLVTNIIQAVLMAAQGAAKSAGSEENLGALFFAIGVSQFIGIVLRLVVDGVFQLGMVRIVLDVLNGRRVDLGRLVSQVSKMPRYVAQLLLVSVAVMIPVVAVYGVAFLIGAKSGGVEVSSLTSLQDAVESGDIFMSMWLPFSVATLLLLPLLIYFTLPLVFMNAELVYGDASPLEVIRRCYVIADGFRLPIFGYGLIAGLVAIVGVLACCLGILPAIGLAQLLMTGLFLAVRNGTGLPAAPKP